MKKKAELTLNQEIVLYSAMRYALGRRTYAVGSVCEELKRNYHALPPSQRERMSKEIQKYQDEHGLAGSDYDDREWNYIKWLFDPTREQRISVNYYQTDKWEEVTAIKGDDGKYYSIPDMKEYHTTKPI